MTGNMIRIQNKLAAMTIDRRGAYIRDFSVNGKPVLYQHPNNLNRASHPCGPIFGALSHNSPLKKDNKYEYNGKLLELPQHGFLRETEWNVLEQAENGVTLEVRHDWNIKNDLQVAYRHAKNFPFNYAFKLVLQLKNNSLDYRLSFKNLSRVSAMIDLASHNYHHFVKGMLLGGLSGLRYMDETHMDSISEKKFMFLPALETCQRDWHIDMLSSNSFTLEYPNRDTIELRILNEYDSDIHPNEIVIWTDPKEGDFICMSPVMCSRNSFNKMTAETVAPDQEIALHYQMTMNLAEGGGA